jgi:aminoglycoside phosphotransferase (APT) family kinase protein
MPEWSPEIEVGEALARRLVSEQFPELELRTLRLLGEGWDNTAWLVDDEWVFRFPRRAIALAGVERERDVLPLLAPQLPLPVPVPVFAGRAGAAFPWPFYGARLVPGVELAEAGLDAEARTGLARPLGEFLRALHRAEVDVELPLDPIRRADMPYRVELARGRFAQLGWTPEGAADVLRAALELPQPEPAAVVHGDLHLRHVLVADGRLSGVIDWGDTCRADPAVDLILYWSALPPEARPDFLAAYGPASEAALLRARVLSLFLCTALAIHARHEGLPAIERESLAGLERTLDG